MIRLLSFLLLGDWHRHKWATVEERRQFEHADGRGLPYATKYILRCELCGQMKANTL